MNNLTANNGVSDGGSWKGFPWSQAPWNEDELDLRQLLTVLQRRFFVIAGVAAGIMGMAVFNTLRQKPVYEGTFQVLVEPVNADNQIKDFSSLLDDALPKTSSGLDYETQVQVLRSPGLIEQVLVELEAVDPDLSYETLLENLSITRVGETKIIEVRYRGGDPVKIQETLNVLSDVYLDYSLKERQTNLRQGIQFVNKQLPELQGKVNDLQSQLEEFRKNHNFIDPSTQSDQIARRSAELSTQRLEIDRQLAQAETSYELLGSSGGSEAALQDAAVYQQLIQDLRQIEAEIAAGLTRFHEDTLEIRTLQDKREFLLPVIEAEAQRVLSAKSGGAVNDIQVLAIQSQTLAEAEMRLQDTLTQLPTLAREYSDLQRELEIAVRALSRFLETRETLEIEAAQTEIPWELIESPLEPTVPISPDATRSLVFGTLAGLVVGAGVALLLEKIDSVCRTADEIRAILKLPLLGIVPYQFEFDHSEALPDRGFVPWLKRYSPMQTDGIGHYGGEQFLESMRLLQTNLLLLGAERPIQSIILSSSMPGEGKSTVARHLAQTAATMGKRVLLVDADLRQPVIHKRLGLENAEGLSDLLSGNVTKADTIRQAMPFVEFYTITAGSIPPDPVKLLSSKRMQRLMGELEKDFDLVIYDSPPLVGLADSTLVAPYTDGMIVVSRVNKCDRDILSHAIENIRLSKIPVLGVAINGVMPNNKGYKYYAYSYKTPKDQQSHRSTNGSANGSANHTSDGGLKLVDILKTRK